MSFKKILGIEKILIGLEKTSRTDTRFADKAKSLLEWYNKHGDLSFKQRGLATAINRQCWATGKQKQAAYYHLYAIDDGVNVKLGFASSPKSRLKNLQTGQAKELEIVWTLPVGTNQTRAHKAERQLHRVCRRYHKRGEWFSRDCMDLVRKFQFHERMDAKNADQEHELEILNEARARI